MDLLVQDGWLPSYNIAAVLLQIRMAISSLEPRPARLARGDEWKRAYGTQEAFDGMFMSYFSFGFADQFEGFQRAAATHGWRVPDGTRQLVMR
jgi:ubiquitin-conjugating enzyme E2 Q